MIFKSDVMNLNFKSGVGFLTFKDLENYDFLIHSFSTRLGGVSDNEFSSMNLSFTRGDSQTNVFRNYHKFCDAIGVDYNTLVASKQDHHDKIRKVKKEDIGIGIYKEHDLPSVDGLITNEPLITLVTYYADCTPIYFVDPIKKVVALAHAGWRGTILKIAKKMVDIMQNDYFCSINDIKCAIGPCIGPCCYEVDYDVASKFKNLEDDNTYSIVKNLTNGKYSVNLYQANKQILLSCGIKEENITLADICTRCYNDLLFSHRAASSKRGCMAAMISIKY